MHATAQRLRLRYPADQPASVVEDLVAVLSAQAWVRAVQWRQASRSVVIELASGWGCGGVGGGIRGWRRAGRW